MTLLIVYKVQFIILKRAQVKLIILCGLPASLQPTTLSFSHAFSLTSFL